MLKCYQTNSALCRIDGRWRGIWRCLLSFPRSSVGTYPAQQLLLHVTKTGVLKRKGRQTPRRWGIHDYVPTHRAWERLNHINIGNCLRRCGLARADFWSAKSPANARLSCIRRYLSDSITTSKYRAGKPAPIDFQINSFQVGSSNLMILKELCRSKWTLII